MHISPFTPIDKIHVVTRWVFRKHSLEPLGTGYDLDRGFSAAIVRQITMVKRAVAPNANVLANIRDEYMIELLLAWLVLSVSRMCALGWAYGQLEKISFFHFVTSKGGNLMVENLEKALKPKFSKDVRRNSSIMYDKNPP